MTNTNPNTQFASKTALVTGANSGLGFEAAAQLAEAGYGRVILACRTFPKAEGAKQALAERVGSDPFETLAVDVGSIKSAEAASAELVKRGHPIDTLLLNAGLVSGKEMRKSVDGIEITFAASMIGHHIMALRLEEAALLSDGARVVMVGSGMANNDAPAFMGMTVYDFATETPAEFDDNLHDAMLAFVKGAKPELYDSQRYYATTKLFSAWWSAAMARRFGTRISIFTVAPGPNMGTNVGRHQTGFTKFMMTTIMPLIGSFMGMNQPTSAGAKRYLDVLHNVGQEFVNGKTYTSPPKTALGPLTEVVYPHVCDMERQEVAWKVLSELTGVGESTSLYNTSAR